MCDGLQVRCEPIQTPRWFKPVLTVLLGITQRSSLILLCTLCCIIVEFQESKIVKCVAFYILWKKIILWNGFQTPCRVLSDSPMRSHVSFIQIRAPFSPWSCLDDWCERFYKMQVCVCRGGVHHPAQSYRVRIHLTHTTPGSHFTKNFDLMTELIWPGFCTLGRFTKRLDCNLFSVPVS